MTLGSLADFPYDHFLIEHVVHNLKVKGVYIVDKARCESNYGNLFFFLIEHVVHILKNKGYIS